MTPNRHMARTHLAESTGLEHPGGRPIRHPSTKFGEQIARLRRSPPRNDFTERELLAKRAGMVATATGPIPPSAKPEGAEYRLDAFGAGVFNALRSATIRASSSAQGIGVRLACNDLDLDSAQQLLAFLESQPDLLRRAGSGHRQPPASRRSVWPDD